jgi:hypothetical protein
MNSSKSIGEHIQSWAWILLFIELASSLIIGFTSLYFFTLFTGIALSLLLSAVSFAICVVSTFLTYWLLMGFGEMVENSADIKKLLIEIRNQGNRIAEHPESQTHTRT